jgi:pyridoxal phosphate enzyme (YggS family)
MDETLKIRENLSDIRKNIGIACKKSGRDKDSIKLVVASKYADIVKMKKIYELGIREFGENRANDLLQKSEEMEKDITWHFIGHLQTNKIKKVIPIAEYVHSVDNINTLKEVDYFCKKINKKQNILIEINLSEEDTKYGLKPNDVNIFFQDAVKYNNVKIIGLMTIAPNTNNEEKIRKAFRSLRIIKEKLEIEYEFLELKELSMGMSNDYMIAIEEGSTILRIGSAVFT